MKRELQRIHPDDDSWSYDEYFDYIESVAHEMPASLYRFASDPDRYCLDGVSTLHDARVLSFNVIKHYTGLFSECSTSLEIRLVDQLFEGEMVLKYERVSAFSLIEQDTQTRPADLLLHEFSVVRPGVFSHHIVLDLEGMIFVEFAGFSHTHTKLGRALETHSP